MKNSTMRWNGSLISATLVATYVMVSPAPAAVDPPFKVEASRLIAHAFSALTARYPDVSPQDVDLASRVFFNCHTSTRLEGPGALEQAHFYCTAAVNFDLSNTQIQRVYVDPEGRCVVVKPATGAHVRVHEDGRSRVHLLHSSDSQGQVVDCDDELIAIIAAEDEDIAGHGKMFSVEAKRIMRLAFTAAIESYHDVSPEQIVYDDGITMSVSCDTAPGVGGPTINREIGACNASVIFADESVMVQYRYIDGISCMIGKATDWISVHLDEDGRAEVNYQENTGGGNARGVECDDEFYSSPLPLIDAPAPRMSG